MERDNIDLLQQQRRRILTALGLALFVSLAGFFYSGWSGNGPSDSELKRYFVERRSSFEELARLIEKESDHSLQGISREMVDSNISRISEKLECAESGGVNEQVELKKWTSYRSLLKATGVSDVQRCWERNKQTNKIQHYILFYFWRSSPAPKPALDELCFANTHDLPEKFQLVKDTREGLIPSSAVNLSAEREKLVRVSSIQDNWYVFFVRWGNIPPTPEK